jgi:acetyl-CoA carboxylase carboxyl transferase subunit beta
LLLDPGTWASWGEPPAHDSADDHYREQLAGAQSRSEVDESVVVGEGRILGHRLCLLVSEFGFLGGSIGRAAAVRIAAAIHRATAEGVPVIGMPASGGTRMQEGTPAFVLMPDIVRAIAEHRAAGHAYISYLRHPTTGGVFASWGALGQIVWAQPGALIGFLGPKVYELMNGEAFPEGVQLAEHLAEVGVIDEVVPVEGLRDRLGTLISLLVDSQRWGLVELGPTYAPPATEITGWAAIERTRQPTRADLSTLLESPFVADLVDLHGTHEGERDETVRLLVARIHGKSCVLIGQDRAAQARSALGPAALRTARRGMRLAEELRLPLVSIIDTPGAALSPRAEDGALASEVARTLAAMTTLRVPNVSVLLGQGCGGGALAMLPARAVVCVDDAWLTALPAEGASAIVYGDLDHAAEMADRQHITAHALQRTGFVQQVVTMDDVHLAIADQLWRQRP